MPGRLAALRLGRIDGIAIEIQPFFFLTAGFLSFPWWRSFRAYDVALGVAVVVVLFASVVVHELGHAAAARSFKIGTRVIEINMSGGLAHMEGPAWKTRDNCVIMLAGPLANLVLAALAYAVFVSLWTDPYVFETASDWGELIPSEQLSVGAELFVVRVLRFVVFLNLGLCAVNLLPGFPLDGGRILFVLLARRFRVRTATRVVGLVGMATSAVSVLLFIATLLSGWAILVPPRFLPNWYAVRNPARCHPWG